jgi:hypothetical protein
MTAFMLAPYRDRVEILSDGAIYTPAGVLLGTGYKVRTSAVLPLALVGSGSVAEINRIADAILAAADTTGSVDDTLDILAGTLANIGETPNFDTGLRLAIGAISETCGPVCFVFSTFEDPSSSLPAFRLHRMERCFAQGAVARSEDLAAYGRLSISHGLEKDAAFVFNSMRKQKMTNPADPAQEPGFKVGGHVDLTVIRTDGYEQRRILTWPDEVGRLIDPFALAAA